MTKELSSKSLASRKRTVLLSFCLALLLSVYAPAAIDIQFDYSFDTSNFFSGVNEGRRTILEAAANAFETRLSLENFGAITPTGSNTWSLSFPNPSTGTTVTLNNPSVPAGTIRVYIGARDLPGNLIGYSEYNYSYFGNTAWQNLFRSRDSNGNFDSFGGAIAFDSLAPWYFDTDPSTLESFPGKYDFFSLALHEIGHIFGFTDGANAFRSKISGGMFTGTNVSILNGGPAPLGFGDDLDHWEQGLAYNGQEVLMAPVFFFNERRTITELDFAALRDIGYNVSPIPEPSTSLLVVLALGFGALRRYRVSG